MGDVFAKNSQLSFGDAKKSKDHCAVETGLQNLDDKLVANSMIKSSYIACP
jgi:hypothetical protein